MKFLYLCVILSATGLKLKTDPDWNVFQCICVKEDAEDNQNGKGSRCEGGSDSCKMRCKQHGGGAPNKTWTNPCEQVSCSFTDKAKPCGCDSEGKMTCEYENAFQASPEQSKNWCTNTGAEWGQCPSSPTPAPPPPPAPTTTCGLKPWPSTYDDVSGVYLAYCQQIVADWHSACGYGLAAICQCCPDICLCQ